MYKYLIYSGMFVLVNCSLQAEHTTSKETYNSLKDVYEHCQAKDGKDYRESCLSWYQKYKHEVNYLLDRLGRPNGTLLDRAADDNSDENAYEKAELLIEIGAHLNALPIADLNCLYPFSPLYYAAMNRNIKTAELLLQKGACPNNSETSSKPTKRPLNEAIENGDLNMVKLLIKYGADVNAIDYDGRTAFGQAYKWGRPEIAVYLRSIK